MIWITGGGASTLRDPQTCRIWGGSPGLPRSIKAGWLICRRTFGKDLAVRIQIILFTKINGRMQPCSSKLLGPTSSSDNGRVDARSGSAVCNAPGRVLSSISGIEIGPSNDEASMTVLVLLRGLAQDEYERRDVNPHTGKTALHPYNNSTN